MSTQKTRRNAAAVNAGSMADIAFLLLIFFLVTTTIQEDKGVLVRLPVWEEEPPVELVADNDVLSVIINSADQLLVEDRESSIADIPNLLRDHVLSPQRKPTNAVISLLHDRGTSYESYLRVYDALKAGYLYMWDELANRRFGKAYQFLSLAQQRSIKREIPMIISEAEPSDWS